MKTVTRDGQRDRQQRDDRQQRADPEHHQQDADDRAQRGDELGERLLERVRDVVDVVGDAAQRVAAGMRVEVAQGQARQLGVDIAAHPVDRPLGDAGHDVGLAPGEQRADDVDGRDEQEGVPERGEVDARAGRRDGQAREQVGLLGLTGGAQRIHGLLLGHARGDLLADDTVEDDVGRVAQDLRADDGAGDAQDGERDDEDDPGGLGTQRPGQPPERALEVLGLLGRQAGPAERAAHARRRTPGHRAAATAAAAGAAHAASSALICE